MIDKLVTGKHAKVDEQRREARISSRLTVQLFILVTQQIAGVCVCVFQENVITDRQIRLLLVENL